ncbi:unnamed protein product [Phyllotreta striolata]|uniref:N-acetyltransferase ESCO2 n=1 Tax=Phyllotreta striolata TaxID=444603 RepID=A0A9N9TPM5_PHYSR|nr:unnamed protein product [Phyllotreta striolata]
MSILERASENINFPSTRNRRRSLFPSDEDCESESELGHMSPLNYEPTSDQENGSSKSIADYEILGFAKNSLEHTPKRYNNSDNIISPNTECMETSIAETPSKTPRPFNLMTPHDASNTNSKLPKLSRRKSVVDSDAYSNSSKRKLSPEISPEQNKQMKLDPKCSRVRTSLFPEENLTLSTKSFYPKSEDILTKIMNKKVAAQKLSISFKVNKHHRRPLKKIGQINAGVTHKIRKPRQRKIVNFPKKITKFGKENGALIDYIMDLKELNSNEPTKLIKNKDNESTSQKLITPAVVPQKPVQTESASIKTAIDPDTSSKKFFKLANSKGVVTLNNHIQLAVDHGKVNILDKSGINYDTSDLNVEDDSFPETNLTNILSCLSDDENDPPPGNTLVLQATSSVLASDNSILLHQSRQADLLLSPISQMCDVTSGLALDTPKKGKNLNPVLEGIQPIPNGAQQKRCNSFPISYHKDQETADKREKKVIVKKRKLIKTDDNQLIIDAGQKKFRLECRDCGFVYNEDDPDDEMKHLSVHNAKHVFRFQGWKNEKIVDDFLSDGRIIQILPGDSPVWFRKVEDLLNLINIELGCQGMEMKLTDCQTYLYIKKRSIIGCLVASSQRKGYKMLSSAEDTTDLCSETAYTIKCGVSRIWVSNAHRKLGYARKLMDSMRRHFVKGYYLQDSDIALSSPTQAAKGFAEKYFNTKQYLVYL